MRVGIVCIKDGVIWVSFRGKGQFLPQVMKQLVFSDLQSFRDSLRVVGAQEFMGTIGPEEDLTYFTDFSALAEWIWPIIVEPLISSSLEFNRNMKHHRFAVEGSWRVYVHSLVGEFYSESGP